MSAKLEALRSKESAIKDDLDALIRTGLSGKDNLKKATALEKRLEEVQAKIGKLHGYVDRSQVPVDQPDSSGITSEVIGWDDEEEATMAASVSTDASRLGPDQSLRGNWPTAVRNTQGLSLEQLFRYHGTGSQEGMTEEQRALAGQAGSTGGFAVPENLGLQILDIARANSMVIGAGATTIPLTTDQTVIATLESDPTATWRVENEQITESDSTFGQKRFKPKSLAILTRVPIELLDDSINAFEPLLVNSLTSAMALELDRAALYGDGADGEPVGLFNDSDLDTATVFAALANYDAFLDAQLLVENADYQPSGWLYSPTVANGLAKMVTGLTSDETKLVPPARFTAVPARTSTAVNTAHAFTGEWAQFAIGVRDNVKVRVIDQLYADFNQIAFVTTARLDMLALRIDAFAAGDDVAFA